MANKSKDKGNRFERLLVKYLETFGIPARRAWGSNGRSMGWHEEVDILAAENIKIQAKVRNKLPSYIKPSEEVDLQIIKEDRGETFVLMRLDDWIQDFNLINDYQKEIVKLKAKRELEE